MKIQLAFFVGMSFVLPVFGQEVPCSFHFGLVAKESINLNGNNLTVDSFDSTDLSKSTAGLYDAAKRQAYGNLAVGVALTNTLSTGSASIYGSVLTSPTGTVMVIGSNGSLGPAFVTADRATNEVAAEAAGWIRHDCGLFMSSAFLEGFTWALPPGTTGTGNITKTTILRSGEWRVVNVTLNSSSHGDTLEIAGFVQLYVTGNVNSYPLITASRVTVNAATSPSDTNVFLVTVNYDASNMFIYSLPSFVPAPPSTIVRTAAIPRGGY